MWLRLKNHLDGLLVDVADGCLKWYNRQLHEAASARFIDLQGSRYAKRPICLWRVILVTISLEDIRNHNIAVQPRALKGDVWYSHDTVINLRRARGVLSLCALFGHGQRRGNGNGEERE